MPSFTGTMNDANFALLVTGVERIFERNDGETDGALVKRWLKSEVSQRVHVAKTEAARDAIGFDDTVIDVT